VLPGSVTGFYVVGSVALGAYNERRSDIDFVAVVDGSVGPEELQTLRREHLRTGARSVAAAVRARRSPMRGMLNGVFIRADDLALPVTTINPVAHQVGARFQVGGSGSDVSPVGWKVFVERAITCRGPEPSALHLDPQPELLEAWNRTNLLEYWLPWAHGVAAVPRRRIWWRQRWLAAWGVLGPPRLHRTITTGDVISKADAGMYALDTFPSEFHPIIEDALAYWRMQHAPRPMSLSERRRRIVDFVFAVVDDTRT